MGWKSIFGKKAPATRERLNDAVRTQLAGLGDSGVDVRHVLHFAYPLKGTSLASRPAMVEDLKAQGFEVRDAAAGNGLVLEHYRSVEPKGFDALTETLEAWFAGRGWDYDGWECEVRQGPAH